VSNGDGGSSAVISAGPVLRLPDGMGDMVGVDDARGTKRRRPGSPDGVEATVVAGAEFGGMLVPDIGYHVADKRARQQCFKCGGDGHIAVMCPSRPGSADDPSGVRCHGCNGLGHFLKSCPSRLQRDQCWKCFEFGHRGRDCPSAQMYAQSAAFGVTAPHLLQNHGLYGTQAAAGFPRSFLPGGPMMMSRTAVVGPVPGTGRCFRCNEPGHWTRDCPQRPIGDGDRDGCYKCGRAGHRARDCDVCYKCLQPGHKAVNCPSQV